MTAASDGDLLILSDAQCQEVVDEGDAFRAVEGVFAAMAAGSAVNFLVIREAIGRKTWWLTVFLTTSPAFSCLILIRAGCRQLWAVII